MFFSALAQTVFFRWMASPVTGLSVIFKRALRRRSAIQPSASAPTNSSGAEKYNTYAALAQK